MEESSFTVLISDKISFFVFQICKIEHLDFLNTVDPSEIAFQQFSQLEHDYVGYQSLTDVPLTVDYTEMSICVKVLHYNPINLGSQNVSLSHWSFFG